MCFHPKLKDVVVEFADWSEWKDKYSSEIALSWIDKYVPASILINETFWERYRDLKDQEEKNRILFIVSLCIIHEIGNSMVQWSNDPKFKVVVDSEGDSYKVMPLKMIEAGRFLERQLFYQEIAVIIQESSKSDWSAKSKIIEVALDSENQRYLKIDDTFIAQICQHRLKGDDLFNFKVYSKKRIPKGQVALQIGENDEEDIAPRIKSNIVKCGTRLLFPHESDEESDENGNEN